MNHQKCVKEGVKRAQMFSSMNKGCGLSFFCTIVEIDIAEGSSQPNTIDLLKSVMEGANKNSKAKMWGKFFITSNDTQVVGYGHVPKSLAVETKIDIIRWHDILTRDLPNVETQYNEESIDDKDFIGFVSTVDPQAEMFPFKLCDDIVQKNIDFLKKEKMIVQESDDGDDEVNFAEEAGIEW